MSYGWVIVAISFVTMMLSAGNRYMMGVFVPAMQADLGWGFGYLALVVSVFMLVYGLFQPAVGQLTDRVGGRWVVAFGLAVLGGGFMLSAYVTAPWQLMVTWGLLSGIGYAALTGVVFGAVIQKWFTQNRGRALGISNSGQALAQVILVPLAVVLTSSLGWRTTMLLAGAIQIALLPLAFTLLKDAPVAAAGRKPAGDVHLAYLSPEARPFWLLALGFFGCGFTMMMMVTHLPGIFAGRGLSKTEVAAAMGALGIANILGTVLVSSLSDKFGRKNLLSLLYALRAVMLLVLILVPAGWVAWAFAIVFGATWIGTGPLTSALTGDFYGVGSIGKLMGWTFLTHQVGGFLGSYVGGLAIDLTGSYAVPLAISVVISATSAAAAFQVPEYLTRRPAAAAAAGD